MDERQTQIKEGAGLEESRLNQDLIDFLQKYSTVILLLVVVLSGGYYLYQQYQLRQQAEVNDAFAQLAQLMDGGNPSPVSLEALADEFDGVRSVAEIAKLNAADVYLNAAISGIAPGAERNQETGEIAEEDVLTDEDRLFNLERAGQLFRDVKSGASEPGMEPIAINAAFGVAAVAASGGDLDAAKAAYEEAKALAAASGWESHVKVADARIEGLASLPAWRELPAASDLPDPPADRIVPPAVGSGVEIDLPSSSLDLGTGAGVGPVPIEVGPIDVGPVEEDGDAETDPEAEAGGDGAESDPEG